MTSVDSPAVSLLNTLWADQDGVHDRLVQHATTRVWTDELLTRPEFADLPKTRPSLVDLFGLRENARLLAAEATSDPRPIALRRREDVLGASAAVNSVAGAGSAWPSLSWKNTGPVVLTRHLGSAADAVLARLAGDVIAAVASNQLGACLAPGCVLYFDRDRPRREWCSAACGNRARVARHYARTHRPSKPHP